jgi:hypothetical protein
MPLSFQVLEKFKKDINVFVETGTYKGDGIVTAIKAGFQQIYSIEFSKLYYDRCCRRFRENSNVKIVLGSSAEQLKNILKDVSEHAIFWLDAHSNKDLGWPEPLTESFPLLLELEQIKQHPIRNHTLLIDDRRLFADNFGSWPVIKESDVIAKLKEINPGYNISYVDSPLFKDDIIAAEI